MSWAKSKPIKRTTGRKLQRRREYWFKLHPLCAKCLELGRVTIATELDHIIPLAEGGADTLENSQGLCAQCHKRKSEAEAARAQGHKVRGYTAEAGVDGVPTDEFHPWNKK